MPSYRLAQQWDLTMDAKKIAPVMVTPQALTLSLGAPHVLSALNPLAFYRFSASADHRARALVTDLVEDTSSE